MRPNRSQTSNFRPGASVRLLVDADQFLPAMLAALRGAQQQILLETYLITSDETGRQVIDALCERAQAGVSVWLVFDAVGSRLLSDDDRRRLLAAGARLRMFHELRLFRFFSTFWRTHRRILVVDNRVGYIGGYGFSDFWTERSPIGKFHELAWEVQGAPLTDLSRIFRSDWGKRDPPPAVKARPDEHGLPYRVLNVSRLRRNVLRRLMRRFSVVAQRRLWIATGYFNPNFFLRRELQATARRGVDVRLILTGEKTDHPAARVAGGRHYLELLKAGVRIFESRERPMHAKAAIMDEEYAIVGSTNLDKWSIRFNRELNIEVMGAGPNGELAKAMLAIQAASHELTLEAWINRPFTTRFLERFWGALDDLI